MVLEKVLKPPFDTKEIVKISELSFSDFQINLAKFINYYYTTEFGVVFNLFTPFKNLNTSFDQEFTNSPTLSDFQQDAKNFINNHDVSLLFGDTGSGKSEIYISIITDILNSGKQALFLMPEISLTPQMTKRLYSFFGDSLGVWHSKISPKKKKELIQNLQDDKIKIIAGARSALFLPFKKLGVIIVDEEHDESYKSSSTPFYNAKDLSIYMHKFGIKVILGSATPDLVSYYKIPHFRLNKTYYPSKKEIIIDESEPEISDKIKQEIASSLKNNKQIIIFLPIRANFKYLTCDNCNSLITCPNCSVTLSYHKDKNALICHYCGYMEFALNGCRKCGSKLSTPKKFGTSEVVDILSKEFPQARISKFDKDIITTQKKLESILNDFNDHKIDILVGTQMLSKGHNYHDVSLSIILGIDEYLNYPDFLARQKTLSLAIQVAGRAGRSSDAKVILQTTQKEFFNEYLLNYEKFLNDELEFLQDLYPPFTRLLRVVVLSKSEISIINFINIIKNNNKFAELIGSSKCVIERISNNYRYEILFRDKSHIPLIKTAKLIQKIATNFKNIKVNTIIDPLEFL